MKHSNTIKKYFLMILVALLPMQQLTTSGSKLTTTHIISSTAIVGAIAYATYLHLNQPATTTIPHASTSHIKSIVFDLDGVLSATNKLRAFREIGIPVTLWEIADQMQLPSEKILFDALAGVPAVSTYTSYNKGLRMPQIMIDWQTGAQELPIIRKSITDYLAIASQPESLKNWVVQSAMMMTDPTKFIATRQTIPTNIKLLHELKDKDYKLYILSNWDPTSFPLFKETFPEIFMHKGQDTFDGIMISGNVGIVKPEASIFKKCLHTFHLTAKNTLFIDDEPANIVAAQQSNIKTILCNPHNTQALRDHVIEQLQD
jgi:FMN phosphatase YigB (HAD superfamily)